ncbi:hypothetical protein AOLI_G00062820 [Acnodon oligacanthus]
MLPCQSEEGWGGIRSAEWSLGQEQDTAADIWDRAKASHLIPEMPGLRRGVCPVERREGWATGTAGAQPVRSSSANPLSHLEIECLASAEDLTRANFENLSQAKDTIERMHKEKTLGSSG